MAHSEVVLLERLTELLAHRAYEMGCSAFSARDEPIDLELALDAAGPVTWALVIHANALAGAAGLTSSTETNALPLYVSVNPDAPFGNEVCFQPGRIPRSITTALLDASMEHAICLGINHYQMTLDEWDNLEDGEKTIPIEPYISDLQNNWVTPEMESGDVRTQVYHWPLLLNRENFASLQPSLNTGESNINRSRMLGFPAMA